MRDPAYCNTCIHFPLKQSMPSGRAMCSMFEREHGWDDRACVLYTRSPDSGSRRALVVQLHQQKTTANRGV